MHIELRATYFIPLSPNCIQYYEQCASVFSNCIPNFEQYTFILTQLHQVLRAIYFHFHPTVSRTLSHIFAYSPNCTQYYGQFVFIFSLLFIFTQLHPVLLAINFHIQNLDPRVSYSSKCTHYDGNLFSYSPNCTQYYEQFIFILTLLCPELWAIYFLIHPTAARTTSNLFSYSPNCT